MKKEQQKEHLTDVYSEEDIKTMPSFVIKQKKNILVTGKRKMTLILPNGEHYFLGNKLNELTGSQWTFFSNSVVLTRYSTTGPDNCAYSIRKIHPSPKPPMLLKTIIEFFTKTGDSVLDFYMGVGGTLLGASLCGRKACGIELNQIYIDAYKKASESMNLPIQSTFCGDSEKVLFSVDFKRSVTTNFRLIVIDPPYGNMMSKEKTGDDMKKRGSKSTPFSNSPFDIGNMPETQFWDHLVNTVKKSLEFLVNKGYLVVFIKDLQPKGKEPNLLHAKMVEKLTAIPELYYVGMKIWVDQTVGLFPYGYPFAFVANQIHQYILIFQKKTS